MTRVPTTSDEKLGRVRACLAEAGYDPNLVTVSTNPDGSARFAISVRAPRAVVWKALWLSARPHACWPCYRDAPLIETNLRCDHDKDLEMPPSDR